MLLRVTDYTCQSHFKITVYTIYISTIHNHYYHHNMWCTVFSLTLFSCKVKPEARNIQFIHSALSVETRSLNLCDSNVPTSSMQPLMDKLNK